MSRTLSTKLAMSFMLTNPQRLTMMRKPDVLTEATLCPRSWLLKTMPILRLWLTKPEAVRSQPEVTFNQSMSIFTGVWIDLKNGNPSPPNCNGGECMDDGWYWETSSVPLEMYHVRWFRSPHMIVDQNLGCIIYRRSLGHLDDFGCNQQLNAYVCQRVC